MKQYSHIIVLLISLNVFSQGFDKKTIQTTSKSVLIELASVEDIELSMNSGTESIEILYKNTDIYNTPIVKDNGMTTHISVQESAYLLNGTKRNKYRAGQPLYPQYHISVPRGKKVKLRYDKGNLRAANFSGTLEVSLDAGNVSIDQFQGTVRIESFSGQIHCALQAATIDITSTHGEIASVLRDKRLLKTQRSLKGIFNNTKNVLKINTIHAKVNLNMRSTKK